MLIDEGTLARWYLDDAVSGQSAIAVADAIAPPVDLDLVYVGPSPVFDMLNGNLGLRWSSSRQDGRARALIAGTKFEDLDSTSQVTLEFVAKVDDVYDEGSAFINIGSLTGAGVLAIRSSSIREIDIRWAGDFLRTYDMVWDREPHVVHVVIDTERQADVDRVALYVDGLPVAPNGETIGPPLGSTIPLTDENNPLPVEDQRHTVVLGNRDGGERSFEGHLQYAAIYMVDLNPQQVAANAQALLVSDDRR